MNIYVVRHGQTDFNLNGLMQGITDNPLNSTGIRQAVELSKKLQDIRFEAIYSSPLKRALQTAQIIRARNAYNPPIIVDDRLKEIDMGKWEGRKFMEVREENEELFRKIDRNPFLYNPPEGETFEQLVSRVESFLRELLSKDYENVLIVAHQIVNGVIRTLLSGEPWENFWKNKQKNGEIWVFQNALIFDTTKGG